MENIQTLDSHSLWCITCLYWRSINIVQLKTELFHHVLEVFGHAANVKYSSFYEMVLGVDIFIYKCFYLCVLLWALYVTLTSLFSEKKTQIREVAHCVFLSANVNWLKLGQSLQHTRTILLLVLSLVLYLCQILHSSNVYVPVTLGHRGH